MESLVVQQKKVERFGWLVKFYCEILWDVLNTAPAKIVPSFA